MDGCASECCGSEPFHRSSQLSLKLQGFILALEPNHVGSSQSSCTCIHGQLYGDSLRHWGQESFTLGEPPWLGISTMSWSRWSPMGPRRRISDVPNCWMETWKQQLWCMVISIHISSLVLMQLSYDLMYIGLLSMSPAKFPVQTMILAVVLVHFSGNLPPLSQD